MSKLQERRYKEVTPEETVKKLKELLKKADIQVEEDWRKPSSVGTYSLRLRIKGTDIGQNGKGMTKEFAMASAYAEFFERFQNGMFRFRMEKPTKEIPFSNSPDEKYMNAEELMKTPNSFFEHILEANGKQNSSKEEQLAYIQEVLNEKSTLVDKEKFACLPYYSVKHNQITYVPDRLFSYLYDTNGMCAGNSPEEALIEGLSEILERYVGFQILKKKITLPEIPEEYIAKFPKVQKMVDMLKQNPTYWYRLVDCSLGGKYPVAGLYMIEKNTGKFGFKLGAHPDYGIAMERCFTEASQGRDIYEYAQRCLFDFYAEEEQNTHKNLVEFLFTDLSAAPYEVIGEKPQYSFTPIKDVSNEDNKTILTQLIQTILKEGKDILVRDVSILGFPSYSIAVPGMSDATFDPNATYFSLFITMQKLLMDLENINSQNIAQVTKMMETIVNTVGYEKLSLLISLKDTSILPCESMGMGAKYFLAICYIANKEYYKAAKTLENLNFLTEQMLSNPLEKIMVKAVYYYACAMDKLNDHAKAMYYISILFDEEIANAIDQSFKDQNSIISNHYGITKDDYVDYDDSYYLPFMKKLREAQRDNYIDQTELKKVVG